MIMAERNNCYEFTRLEEEKMLTDELQYLILLYMLLKKKGWKVSMGLSPSASDQNRSGRVQCLMF